MSRARILILLFAIGCAVLAALLARGMIGRQSPPPTAEAPKPVTMAVLVAAKDIAIGERLSGLAMEWREWPRDNVASFMITRDARPEALTELDGARALVPMLLGEPIAERKIVASKDGGLMSALVPKGMRAMAIRISDRSAASGFILPNDRVDIIANFKVALNSRGDFDRGEIMFSRTVVSNVRVLSINRNIAAPDGSASLPDLETAVVELDPGQAEIVARTELQGDLTLVLRSIEESDGADSATQKPQLASTTADPHSVSMFRPDGRGIFSCEADCVPTLQVGNSPFPLVVRNGVNNTVPNR